MNVDVAIIGAGIVGCATAAAIGAAGLRVCVIDRVGPLAGTTAAGEGNLLVSDKLPGPELDLILRSLALWQEFGATEPVEFEHKGGLVVAWDDAELAGLTELAGRQDGVIAEICAPREFEPQLSPELVGGVFYPQDCQVQPMAAALAYLRRSGAHTMFGATVLSGRQSAGRLTGVLTTQGPVNADWFVLAAGPWSAPTATVLGGHAPVRPRRGHILVTEPAPPLVKHKVYEAGYVATTVSNSAALQYSAVVEATASGTILIGSSREFVEFDRTINPVVMAELARRAISLFPALAGVRVMRCYVGFRPASPDHFPIVGPDPRIDGLILATGHEGAGIGLAPATAEMVANFITGAPQSVDPAPFSPARFAS